MEFRPHLELRDKHAPLSASKSSWLRYSDERLYEYIEDLGAAAHGSRVHNYAAMAIALGMKQPNNTQTVNMYINDAIGFFMKAEQPLYYSRWAFGTADAVCFRDGVLRIFDLKTGKKKANFEQLVLYAGFFNLEYGAALKIKPTDIEYDLRIYQNDDIRYYEAENIDLKEDILAVMDRTVEASALLDKRMEEEGV